MSRNLNMLMGGALALIVLAGVGLLLVPQWRAIARFNDEIAKLQRELEKPRDGPEVIGALEIRLATLRRLGEGRMTPIPADSGIAGLIAALSDSMSDIGAERPEVTTGDSRSHSGGVMSIPVAVTLRGRFLPMVEALRHIEGLPRLVRVERMRLVSEGSPRGPVLRTGEIRADITIEAFFAPPAVAEPAQTSSRGGSGKESST